VSKKSEPRRNDRSMLGTVGSLDSKRVFQKCQGSRPNMSTGTELDRYCINSASIDLARRPT